MRFRSGRFWSGIGSRALVFALGGLWVLFPGTSFATVTISQYGGPSGIFSGTNVYFPAYNNNTTYPIPLAGTLFPGVAALNFNQFQYVSGTYPTVNVTWSPTTTPTSSNGYMLVVTMTGTISGNASQQGEVVAAPPGACPGNGGNCFTGTPLLKVTSTGMSTPNVYYGAYSILPGQNLVLSLDFHTMCDSFLSSYGSLGTGCTTLIEPTATTPTYTQVFLTFGIYAVPTGFAPTSEPVWNSTSFGSPVDTSGTVTFNFSAAPSGTSGTFICNMGSAYYPGDGQITVNGQAFTYPATAAPIDGLANVIVVGAQGSVSPAPTLTTQVQPNATNYVAGSQSGLGPYTINAMVSSGPTNVITGFTNSTASDPVYYALGFLGEDLYQFLVQGADAPGPTGSAESCSYPTAVQTASIDTFLSASKCFIATATFRSMDSPPLVLLRAFRDRFLEHFAVGRDFVHWYYAWSPPAAEWLIANPVFRFPIFLALVPLQILAWLILHPLALTFLLMTALSVLSYGLSFRLRGRLDDGKQELRG